MASQRTFRLDDDLDARLVKEAERQGRSVSNLIVWALVRELTPDRPEEALARLETEREQRRFQAVEAKHRKALGQLGVGTPLPKIAPRKQR